MYSQLGNIIFSELKGFDRFSRSRATDFAEIPLILGKPALQRTGEKLTSITLGIQLHTDFADVENSIKEFYDLMAEGEILPLVLGNGLFLGNFVILSLNETVKKTAIDGSIIVANVDIQLKEYTTGDQLAESTLEAKRNGFAADLRKTVPEREVIAPATEAKAISETQTGIQSKGLEIDNATATATATPSRAAKMFAIIEDAGELASIAALEMAELLNQIEFALSNVATLISAAESVASLATNAKLAAQSAIIGDVQTANSALKIGNSNLLSESSLLDALISSRQI
jgi:phage protein U